MLWLLLLWLNPSILIIPSSSTKNIDNSIKVLLFEICWIFGDWNTQILIKFMHCKLKLMLFSYSVQFSYWYVYIHIQNLCQLFKYMNIHIQWMDIDWLSMHIHVHWFVVQWQLNTYSCPSLCTYVWICIWHYAYMDFKVFDFFKVEGYAFKCLRFCKFLLPQTLNDKKVKHFPLCLLSFWWSLVWQQGFFLVYAFLLFLQILWARMNYSFLLQEQGHVCFVVVATNRCFIIVILKIIWLCLKILLLSSNSWFFKPFQIITYLRKIQCQAYVTRGNQFVHITFQLALLQLTWLQEPNVEWMSKQHKVFSLSFVYVDQYCGWSKVHIICYLGALNMTTSPFHWQLLQKARCFFLSFMFLFAPHCYSVWKFWSSSFIISKKETYFCSSIFSSMQVECLKLWLIFFLYVGTGSMHYDYY